VVTNEFPPWVLLATKLESHRIGTGEDATVDRLATAVYADSSVRNLTYRAIYRWTPRFAFAAAQTFNRRVVLPWRSRR
jgi:hypothetical protein